MVHFRFFALRLFSLVIFNKIVKIRKLAVFDKFNCSVQVFINHLLCILYTDAIEHMEKIEYFVRFKI